MLYEGVVLFGLVMLAGYLYSSVSQQRHALQGRHGLQAFVFLVLGIYFVWFWSRSGQTVAMKAWHVRLVGQHGEPVTQWRALARFVTSWVWFLPALLAIYLVPEHGPPLAYLAPALWVLVYAATAWLHPQRQFWHDVLCGTRLVQVPDH
jgi:uncharacterized RDD family membrane protein YckC